jgi:hypothetical protein
MKKMLIFHAVTFLSAFLLFQIQPMTSKLLLPAFGGSYLVWGSCMVFYQTVLLLGYIYAHFVQRWFGVIRYGRLHWLLLLASVLAYHSRLQVSDALVRNLPQMLSTVIVLGMQVGLPVFVLSTTSLVLQRWLSVSSLPGKDNPYVLYGASNLGSVLGLLTYPVVLEPLLRLQTQWDVWWIGYAIVICLTVFCAPFRGEEAPAERNIQGGGLSASTVVACLMLGLAASALSLAVTNVITLDVASVPFLWVLPLTVFLLSFVVTFKRKPWRPAWMWKAMYLAVIVGALLHLMMQLRLTVLAPFLIAIHLAILFTVCVACNGRLISLKPANPQSLTTFYLLIAVGGLAGSLLVNWIVPLISSRLIEYPLALVIAAAAIALGNRAGNAEKEGVGGTNRERVWAIVSLIIAVAGLTVLCAVLRPFVHPSHCDTVIRMLVLAILVAGALLMASPRPWQFALTLAILFVSMTWTEDMSTGATSVLRLRNYYGIYRVFDVGDVRYLKHGTTEHGCEYLRGPRVGEPLGYYDSVTPDGEVLSSTNFNFKNIGMIGLGTGALATYFGEGQTLTIYELDPDNLSVADKYFTYLGTARKKGAKLSFVFGDGRISLRQVKDSSLDLLVVDAFNSGSIPVHLITVEAIEDYMRVLKRDGLLLMHVSNRLLDLVSVAYSNARAANVLVCDRSSLSLPDPEALTTVWVAMSKNHKKMDILVRRMDWGMANPVANLPRAWTDEYSDLLSRMWFK